MTGTVTIPPGCQNQATLTSSVALPVMGVSPADAGQPEARRVPLTSGKVAVRPGPSNQLVFFWSSNRASSLLPPGEKPADVQAGVSCLADVSPALIQVRLHVAYQVQSGRVDSLAWHVPAGYVLETLQGQQLAGHRFEAAENGNRRLLVEFSRPQTGDFSLVAKFAFPINRNEKQNPLPLINPLHADHSPLRQVGLRFHQIALRYATDLRVGISPTLANQPFKPRLVDDFLREWNAADARPQQAFDLEHTFAVNVLVESLPGIPRVSTSSTATFHPGHLDWTFVADVAPAVVPQFLYRIQIDPRLRIRSISVQEDGAERLLRWSQTRESVVLFLNDKTTRAQTVRVEATLPYTASQEFGLPRIRFAEVTPVVERVSLYRDADVSVRLTNPENFSTIEIGDPSVDGGGELLVARMEVLPEQAGPQVVVEPVLPQLSAETATVLEFHEGGWQFTTAVDFQVASGQVNDFTIEIPEAIASRVTTRSIPASQVSRLPAVEGRVTLMFHPDVRGLRRFVAILSGAADLSPASWHVPSIQIPGAEQKATFLCAPRGTFEPMTGAVAAEAVATPDWVQDVAPATAVFGSWNSYRWAGAASDADIRLSQDESSQTVAGAARIDVWLAAEGTVAGWLGLSLEGNLPPTLDLDWPEHARPTGLYAGGAFQPLPEPADGRCTIPLPPNVTDRLVWLSWSDSRGAPPGWSGEILGGVPWPRQIPVEKCRVHVHYPQGVRVMAVAPLRSATEEPAESSLMPSVVADRKIASHPRPGDDWPGDVSWAVVPVPESGQPLDLGASLMVANQWPQQFCVALAAALIVALVGWKSAPFWAWITDYETAAWLILSIFWWLCLEPSWLGFVIALGAVLKALRRRKSPGEQLFAASTAHGEPFG